MGGFGAAGVGIGGARRKIREEEREMEEKLQKRNDHYVPQVYLRGFTGAKWGPSMLCRYDKCRRHRRWVPMRDLASDQYFERYPDNSIDSQDVDVVFRLLHEVDRDFEGLRSRLEVAVATRQDIDETLKIGLADFIGFQYARNQTFRETSAGALQELMVHRDWAPEETGSLMSNAAVKRWHLDAMVELWRDGVKLSRSLPNILAEEFHAMAWAIVINRTERQFYTSDNPVVNILNVDISETHHDDVVEIYRAFPVTPSLLLLMGRRRGGNAVPVRYIEFMEERQVDSWNT